MRQPVNEPQFFDQGPAAAEPPTGLRDPFQSMKDRIATELGRTAKAVTPAPVEAEPAAPSPDAVGGVALEGLDRYIAKVKRAGENLGANAARIRELEAAVQAGAAQNTELTGQLESEQAYVLELEQTIETEQARAAAAETRADAAETEVERLRADLAAARDDLATLKRHIVAVLDEEETAPEAERQAA